MTKHEELLGRIRSLLQGQNCGVLATHGSEYPYTTLVGYASSNDCREIVFATIRDTRKFSNLKKTPTVSLLIDTRVNQVHDFQDATALTVLGTAGELDENAKKDYQALYLSKHPYLEEFVTAPNCSLIRISVAKYILVDHFQNVIEYTPL
jgi:nitroimidazol reductase NimA-like FMN-containing flavoprotein (pyridoxamine 5'-phosphate oxidase superfamily)